MKHLVNVAFCFVSGLVLNTGLCADNRTSPNPFAPIVTRNIFDLNPPQPVNTTPPEPPSQITPDGIMTIFGTRQVLFNVAVPPHPPEPATEKSYILSEGQRQDDIEVTHIDEKAGIVTFNNHGVVQQIPLVKAPPITTPTPVVMNSGFAAPSSYNNEGGNGGGNFARFGNRRGQNPGMANNGGNSGNPGNADGNMGSTGYGSASGGSTGGPGQPPLTPEEQMLMIAAQHAELQKEGNPMAAIMPPTPLDEAAGVVPTPPAGGSSSQ